MPEAPQEIIIIGAGQAGLQAAAALRQQGYGGSLKLIGEEPHAPYERPPLSKAYLKGETARERLFFRRPNFYLSQNIEHLASVKVKRIEPDARKIQLADGSLLDYDRLLIATGVRMRRLDISGAELPGVHYLHTLDDSDKLRSSMSECGPMVIIGGGFIGLEVAASARSRGIDVTVLEATGQLMGRAVSWPISEYFAELHRRNGVRIELKSQASAILGDARVSALETRDGERLAAANVVIGIGATARTRLAKDAGLEVDDGILVDAQCCTSDPHIYAAGDCTRFPSPWTGGLTRLESVSNAVAQARVAAVNMLGGEKTHNEIPWFWSDQYEARLKIAGLALPGDEVLVRGDAASNSFSAIRMRNGRVSAVETVNNSKDFVGGKKLIAAGHIIDKTRATDTNVKLKRC